MKELYNNLIQLIKEKGQSFPKRHGVYVRVTVFDDWSLELDTWNKAIYVLFKGQHRYDQTIGIDWGGFSCYKPQMLNFWIAHLKMLK